MTSAKPRRPSRHPLGVLGVAVVGIGFVAPECARLDAERQTVAQSKRQNSSPGGRLGHALGYMERDAVVVLFGGFLGDGRPRNDTWAWNGHEWRRLDVPGPPPRRWPAMAYDRRRQRLVVHGGRDGVGARGTPLDDTWAWDGARWQQIAASGPGGRDHHRMVYDARRDRMVLFGGWDGTSTRSDTWELDGNVWRQVSSSGPSARAAQGMAYDTLRGNVVLFGGSADTTFFGDTWRWNGREWSVIASPDPPPRSFHGMVFDASAGVIVMAGGRRGAALYGDTWTFDGTRWQETTDTTLSPRYVYDLAYDARRSEVVFHGGGFMRHGRWALYDDTWARRSGQWTRVGTSDGDRAPVASERCYRFDRFHFQWVATRAEGTAPRVDSANVVSLVDVIHRNAPRTLPPDESPRQEVRIPRAEGDTATMSRWLGASYWRHLSPDSIEIAWRNGRYGSAFRLAQEGDALRGRVEFTSDIRFADRGPTNPGGAAEATAVRIECPADQGSES